MTRIPGKQFIGDFLDFVSGSFRSRIQAGTLTADRALTAPDKTGTISVETARSTSIQNLATAGLVQLAAGADSVASIVPVGVTGLASIAAADQAAGRNAIGVQYLGTQTEIPGQMIGITDWAVPAAASADVMCDRLYGSVPTVTTTGTVTRAPAANLFFNEESFTEFETETVIEVPVNLASVLYSDGFFLIHGYATPGVAPRPTSVKIELYRFDTNAWATDVPETNWPSDNRNLFKLPSGQNALIYTSKVRFTFKGSGFWLTKLRWIVTRSNTNPAILNYETRDQELKSRLILPSLKLGAGATLTAMPPRATKTIAGTNPETITVTGAAVGDIVELSKPVNGEVTAPNIVTFNGTGLSGTITAIVKRYA